MRRKSASTKRSPAKSPSKPSAKNSGQGSSQSPTVDSPLSVAIAHIDSILERIKYEKLKKFDVSVLAQLSKMSANEIKGLNKQFRCTLDGIKGAVGGDEYDLESYAHFSKAQLKVALEYLKALKGIKHDESASGKMRLIGSRQIKPRTPEQITSKVLYLEFDKETGITSKSPVELVGAKELWIYNSKTRKLGAYVSVAPDGLSAKGTTILNFDEAQSRTKTIRKPTVQLKAFVAAANKTKYWNSINSTPQAMPPRMGRESVILTTLRG